MADVVADAGALFTQAAVTGDGVSAIFDEADKAGAQRIVAKLILNLRWLGKPVVGPDHVVHPLEASLRLLSAHHALGAILLVDNLAAKHVDRVPEAVPVPRRLPAPPDAILTVGAGGFGQLPGGLGIVVVVPVAIFGGQRNAILLELVDVDRDGHDVDVLGHADALAQHEQTFPLELVVVIDLLLGHVAVDEGLQVEDQVALGPVEEDVAPRLEDVRGGASHHLRQQLLYKLVRHRLQLHLDAWILTRKVLVQHLLGVRIIDCACPRHPADNYLVSGGCGGLAAVRSGGGARGSRCAGNQCQTYGAHGRTTQKIAARESVFHWFLLVEWVEITNHQLYIMQQQTAQ